MKSADLRKIDKEKILNVLKNDISVQQVEYLAIYVDPKK